jgi:hypothetical protein
LDDLADQRVAHDVSLVVTVLALVHFVELLDVLEDCLVPNNFLGVIDSQKYPFFQKHEVSPIARVHVQVVYFFSPLDVEVFAALADFAVAGLGEGVP